MRQWVGGPEGGIVDADGTVADGPPVIVGGLTVIEVRSREEAHVWATRCAAACRCDQEVWELGFDAKKAAMPRGQTTEDRVQRTPDHAPEQRVHHCWPWHGRLVTLARG